MLIKINMKGAKCSKGKLEYLANKTEISLAASLGEKSSSSLAPNKIAVLANATSAYSYLAPIQGKHW